MALLSQNLGVPAGSACICVFVFACLEAPDVADMIRVVTGRPFGLPELLAMGERLWLLQRGVSNLLGAGSAEDTLPPHVLAPLSDGMAAGSTPDLKRMLAEYYELRGLEASGRPRREALEKAGLGLLAERLGSAG
jgi:aldehyde:ferredoxin oxidoreductase